MINYSRLGYEIKRDFTNFSLKISKGLKRPQEKFVHQMVYGILAGNRLHLSEIARSLKENITLKKTIDRLSKNLNAFDGKDSLMHNYLLHQSHSLFQQRIPVTRRSLTALFFSLPYRAHRSPALASALSYSYTDSVWYVQNSHAMSAPDTSRLSL